MLAPWQVPSHLVLPVAPSVELRYIIFQVRKLRLEEDIQLVSGRVRIQQGSHIQIISDVTLSHMQSIGERVCIPHGNVSRLAWAASQWKKAAAGRAKEPRQLGECAAWAEHPSAVP